MEIQRFGQYPGSLGVQSNQTFARQAELRTPGRLVAVLPTRPVGPASGPLSGSYEMFQNLTELHD
jgi:hypothetical protein